MSHFTLILRPFYIIRQVKRRLNRAKETPTLATKPRFYLLAYCLFEGLVMVFDDEAVSQVQDCTVICISNCMWCDPHY